METAITTTTAVAPFDPKELSSFIKQAPEIYVDLTDRARKAIEAGERLLEKITESGIDEALAEELTTFIKKAKNTKDYSLKQRKPITQMFQLVSKGFTGIEADIEAMIGKVKKCLDDYAAEQARLQAEREAEAARKAAHDKELGELEAKAEEGLKLSFIQHLSSQKRYLNTILEDMQLPLVDSVKTVLKGYDEALSPKDLHWPELNLVTVTAEELTAIKKKVGAAVAPELKAQYKQEIADIKKELLDKVPSKVAELHEAKRLADEEAAAAEKARKEEEERKAAIAKANAKEKARLEEEGRKAKVVETERQAKAKAEQDKLDAERKKRQQEENQRLEAEAEQSRQKAAEEAKAKAESTAMNVMFDMEQVSSGSSVPKGKPTYEITVTHQKGYSEMFALWFAKEGGTMELDKLEKVTLERVRKYFEKLAADGEKMDSKYIKYRETFSTSVRR